MFAHGARVLGTPLCAEGAAVPPGVAHGAVVVPPGGGGTGVAEAHGVFVVWFGPLGIGAGARAETREEAPASAAGGIPPAPAQGARVVCDAVSVNGSRRGGA